MLENAEKLVGHFRFRPQKRLQTLHPLKVRNDYSAGIAENVRNHEDLVPTRVKNEIGVRRSRTISGFSKDSALELARVFPGDYTVNSCRNKNVARQRKEFVWINMIILSERPQVSLLQHVLFGR